MGDIRAALSSKDSRSRAGADAQAPRPDRGCLRQHLRRHLYPELWRQAPLHQRSGLLDLLDGRHWDPDSRAQELHNSLNSCGRVWARTASMRISQSCVRSSQPA